jgi:desulfoferrodoxin (superoxide reductase-like protein)
VKGDDFIAVSEEVYIDIKQEDIPEDKHFPVIQSETDEVSYVFVCLLLYTFSHCPEMSVFFYYVSIFGRFKQLHCWE